MGRGARWWCSYKRATIVVCWLNLAGALYLLHFLCTSFYISSTSSNFSYDDNNLFSGFWYSMSRMKRVEESIRIRRALESAELVRLVNELKKGASSEARGWELSRSVKQKLAEEILQRVKSLKNDANMTTQRKEVELWRLRKLEEVKRMILSNSTSYSIIPAKEARILEKALESDWMSLAEEIGLWIPADVINTEVNDKAETEQEPEEEIVPGRPLPLPPECNAEPHTDYDGAAVRWGLTHHKASAADCCQACLDQAKHAKPGQKKCNIWVYCPSESGCYSPDIYEHRYQECWLKQTNKPRLNFKDKYPESYRDTHPTAPVVVPWISGVVGS